MLVVLCSFAILSTAGLHVLLAITDQSSGNQRTGIMDRLGPIWRGNQTLDVTVCTIHLNQICETSWHEVWVVGGGFEISIVRSGLNSHISI